MRIVLAEDSTLLREGLVGLLERSGHELSGVVDNATALVETVDRVALSTNPPDLVITDVRMPPNKLNDGLEAAIEIRRAHPDIALLVLSQYVADAYALKLLRNTRGRVGYLLKDRVGRIPDFMRSLEVIVSGGVVIDPEMVQHLLSDSASHEPLARLTPRETEVLAKMAEGKSNGEIAATLFVSDAAVAKHIGSIFAKLGLEPDDGHRRVRAVLAYLNV
jgi:DNA-binding NarL/FixJ family response regulator